MRCKIASASSWPSLLQQEPHVGQVLDLALVLGGHVRIEIAAVGPALTEGQPVRAQPEAGLLGTGVPHKLQCAQLIGERDRPLDLVQGLLALPSRPSHTRQSNPDPRAPCGGPASPRLPDRRARARVAHHPEDPIPSRCIQVRTAPFAPRSRWVRSPAERITCRQSIDASSSLPCCIKTAAEYVISNGRSQERYPTYRSMSARLKTRSRPLSAPRAGAGRSLGHQSENPFGRSIRWQGVERPLRIVNWPAAVQFPKAAGRMPEKHQPFTQAIPVRRPRLFGAAQ